MPETHYDYCPHCHRLVGFHAHDGAMCCDRCGKAAQPPMDRRDAIEAIKRVYAQWESVSQVTR